MDWMRYIATMLAILLASPLAAQVVRITNHAASPYTGWLRTKTDNPDCQPVGPTWRIGREIGVDTWAVDVYVDALAPNATTTIDLVGETPADAQAPPGHWPANILTHFGGPLTLNGQPMPMIGLSSDGAAVRIHHRARVGPLLVVDAWLRWYPGQPWMEGEYQCTASNPASLDMVVAAPELRMRYGLGATLIVGRVDSLLLTRAQSLADGQARSAPLLILFPHLVRTPRDYASFASLASLSIAGHGIGKVWIEGTGSTGPGFRPLEFAGANADAARRLHTWDRNLLGPSPKSGDTGEQEDQLFHVGAEGSGLEVPRYLAALKLHSERPCNHREADGRPLALTGHPDLLMWDMRPHKAISRDMLGKPRELTLDETRNRWGADTQHMLTQTLFASIRVKDSPALQQLASNMATNYLYMRTTQPGWSTTATYSAREWLYEPLFAVHCWRNLEDRDLATRVVDRCRDRIEQVLAPAMVGKQSLYVFDGDARLGAGNWVIAWQECAGAYGLDLFGEVFGCQAARDIALRVARFQLENGWDGDQGHWLTRAQFPLVGEKPAPDGSFNDFGMPLAPAVILRHEPSNPVAAAIWQHLQESGAYRWMPPGVK